ncbi:MAG TPA: GNAT family N-acetyltransferase [Rhodocyclaceae bacterium]|nr:GNAT family N-acetyltransferase [Rhodocyclaceae bacterium]
MSASELIEAVAATNPSVTTDGHAHLAPLLDLLRELGADKLPHSGRTFIEHLTGTYDLLKSWDCGEEIALAGLFHSIYGTNAFQQSSLSFERRGELRALIGERAEQLAFLFCSIERPKAFLPALKTRKLINRFNGAQINVDIETLRDLITIECANLIEQQGNKGFISSLMATPQANRLGLPVKLKTAVNQYRQNIGGLSYLNPASRTAVSNATAIPNAYAANASVLRTANENDIVELVHLARELHADSRWQWIYFDKSRTTAQFRDWIADPQRIIIVAQKGDDIVGFAAARIEPLLFTTNSKIARMSFIYVQHRHRGVLALRLLHKVLAWAKQKKTVELRLDDQFGVKPERNAKLFKRLGLTLVGSTTSLWL